MDGIQMEPLGKYKPNRNGSAKAAWRNMVDQELDDVAFLGDSDKAREAHELRGGAVAVCSQRRALCVTGLVLGAMFATALVIVYAVPQPDCPCLDNSLIPGQSPTDAEAAAANANKERISTSGAVFPWRGARLPPFVLPRHYSLWLHPNLTTGELRGEVSIDFKVDRDTSFVVLNIRDMNITERALFRTGGSSGSAAAPKVARALDYPPAEQTYIEFKEKLRRKYNYTLSLRFVTRLERSDKERGFFIAGSSKHRCAVSRFWLTNARSTFPCLDEPHFRATFKLTIVRDRFHVSLTNMPIVATEEAGFYLGHRLLQDEFADTPPMPPHMMSMTVCRLQRRAAPPLPEHLPTTPEHLPTTPEQTTSTDETETEDGPPEISLYSDKQVILDESGPLLEWVQKTIQHFAYELNTSYPLPKLDIVVIEGGSDYSEGWGLITLAPSMLSDYRTIARLLAQQWFGGLVSPRWWSSQWLLDALTSVLGERAPLPSPEAMKEGEEGIDDALLLEHVLPALRLDSGSSVRAIASPRLERADIESATDELSLHKGAAIVSMAIESVGEAAGRSALARLLAEHGFGSADASDLWRALQRDKWTPAKAWDAWCEKPGYPLLVAEKKGSDVRMTQERFMMSADPPEAEPPFLHDLLTADLRADLDELFFEPENFTNPEEDINSTTTTPPPPTTRRTPAPTPRGKVAPPPRWVIPLTFTVGPVDVAFEGDEVKVYRNVTENLVNGSWYDIGNETRKGSRWAENVTHLVWMNDTEMIIPDLGKHQWVRYNVGARGLYRVAPQQQLDTEVLGLSEQYWGGSAAERALALDDALVLSRAGRLSPTRALALAVRLKSERHWAPWRVLLSHVGRWRQLLARSAVAEDLNKLLANLHPKKLDAPAGKHDNRHTWLSGALLTSGVEWGNEDMIKEALRLFDDYIKKNKTIPEMYQEAAWTAGVRHRGAGAWRAAWRALVASVAAPLPTHSHTALIAAMASTTDDNMFYKLMWTMVSPEARRGRDWELWLTTFLEATCRWRGSTGAWQALPASAPRAALAAAATCMPQPHDYTVFKEKFGAVKGAQPALDIIALNVAWMRRAEPELLRYFHTHNVTIA